MDGIQTRKQAADPKLSDIIERHNKLKEQREESKAKSREYYRRLRDAGKVQD